MAGLGQVTFINARCRPPGRRIATLQPRSPGVVWCVHGKMGEYLDRIRHRLKLDQMAPRPRRVLVGVTGGTLLLAGIFMVVLPGPAFVVIPLALAVLATEFVWARRYLHKATEMFEAARQAISPRKPAPTPASPPPRTASPPAEAHKAGTSRDTLPAG